jgi:hypothetical protein
VNTTVTQTEAQSLARPRFIVIEAFLLFVFLFLIFRFTAAATLLVLGLLYAFFPLHRSCRSIHLAYALFFVALVIPIDAYVPGFHGPLMRSKHSGPRFVPVIYGLGARPGDGDEAISGGCVGGIHETRWRFVWD